MLFHHVLVRAKEEGVGWQQEDFWLPVEEGENVLFIKFYL
jgi:hypothetical protein